MKIYLNINFKKYSLSAFKNEAHQVGIKLHNVERSLIGWRR